MERRRYNDLVRTYNTSVKTFPTAMIAGMFGLLENSISNRYQELSKAPKSLNFK